MGCLGSSEPDLPFAAARSKATSCHLETVWVRLHPVCASGRPGASSSPRTSKSVFMILSLVLFLWRAHDLDRFATAWIGCRLPQLGTASRRNGKEYSKNAAAAPTSSGRSEIGVTKSAQAERRQMSGGIFLRSTLQRRMLAFVPSEPVKVVETARTRLGHWTMIDRLMATLGSRSLSEVAQRLMMMFGPDALALAAACGGPPSADCPWPPQPPFPG
ncbi:hypothetical protein ACVWW4_003802 [Bradyrhizobium sp. LB7.1]